jgi:hypothetical protein
MDVHTPAEDKAGDTKDSFHEEPERVLYQFSKYRLKILFEGFRAKVGILRPTVRDKSLREIGNGVRAVNFIISKM